MNESYLDFFECKECGSEDYTVLREYYDDFDDSIGAELRKCDKCGHEQFDVFND